MIANEGIARLSDGRCALEKENGSRAVLRDDIVVIGQINLAALLSLRYVLLLDT